MKNLEGSTKSDLSKLGKVFQEICTNVEKVKDDNPIPELYGPDLSQAISRLNNENPAKRPEAAVLLGLPFWKKAEDNLASE